MTLNPKGSALKCWGNGEWTVQSVHSCGVTEAAFQCLSAPVSACQRLSPLVTACHRLSPQVTACSRFCPPHNCGGRFPTLREFECFGILHPVWLGITSMKGCKDRAPGRQRELAGRDNNEGEEERHFPDWKQSQCENDPSSVGAWIILTLADAKTSILLMLFAG